MTAEEQREAYAWSTGKAPNDRYPPGHPARWQWDYRSNTESRAVLAGALKLEGRRRRSAGKATTSAAHR